jgi:hypothetical protein
VQVSVQMPSREDPKRYPEDSPDGASGCVDRYFSCLQVISLVKGSTTNYHRAVSGTARVPVGEMFRSRRRVCWTMTPRGPYK